MTLEQSIFLSHNSEDKDWARMLASSLKLTGVNVWFDEWTIRPGDSMQTAVSDGLSGFDIFVLVWSKAAANSRWVRVEMEVALDRWINGESCCVVPVRLDRTPLPALLRTVRYINGHDNNHIRVARELLGIESDAAFRIAVQEFITEAGLEFREYAGVGVLVGCPRCGATLDKLEGFEAIDDERDDRYLCTRCKACGWEDGSEV